MNKLAINLTAQKFRHSVHKKKKCKRKDTNQSMSRHQHLPCCCIVTDGVLEEKKLTDLPLTTSSLCGPKIQTDHFKTEKRQFFLFFTMNEHTRKTLSTSFIELRLISFETNIDWFDFITFETFYVWHFEQDESTRTLFEKNKKLPLLTLKWNLA